MKPIRLKFSGLQSYREEQDIDFSELGALGIFGVFGPTGSGKSTILDAITLALFGRVERAKGGTRGILNQFEDKLAVSFQFSLGTDVYLAERIYAREKSDPDSVRIRQARLVKYSTADQVLADKSSDMDSKIVQLLGMSFDDFSRAVILPQGKFDQFLKLTGGDRARMLENILRLERYGENLWQKASHLESSLKQEIQTNQKLLEQLGDASETAVKMAEEMLVRQGEMVLQKEQERKKRETQIKELEQLAELHREFASLQQQQARLEQQKAGLAHDRALLDRALQAEPLRGILTQLTELAAAQQEEDAKVKQQEIVCIQTGQKLKQAEESLGRANLLEEKLKSMREQELPQVALALDYEKQITALEQELQKITDSLKIKQGELTQVTAEGKAKGKRQEQTRAQRDKVIPRKQELNQVLAYRSMIEKALTVLADLETAEQQAAEAEHVLTSRRKVLETEESKLDKVLAEYIDSDLIEKSRHNPVTLAGIVPEIVQQAAHYLSQAQEDYETLVMQNMAVTLAGKLTPNEPCPVCGSTAHSRRAAGTAQDTAAINSAKEKIKAAKARQEKVLAWERKVSLAYNTLQTIKEEIETIHRLNLDRKKAALTAAGEKWRQEISCLEDTSAALQAFTGFFSLDRAGLKSLKIAMDKAGQEYQMLEQQLEAWEQELQQLEPEVKRLRETYLKLKHDVENLQKNQSGTTGKITQLQAILAEITGGQTAREFRQNTEGRILLLEKEITEARSAAETARAENQEAEKYMAALAAGLAKMTGHLTSVRSSLADSMEKLGFRDIEEVRTALLNDQQREVIRKNLEEFTKTRDFVTQTLQEISAKIKDKPFDQEHMTGMRQAMLDIQKEYEDAVREQGALKKYLSDLQAKQAEWQRLQEEINRLAQRQELAARLVSLLKGRKLVQFLAEEHLRDMAAEASLRLAGLTGQRYALELDEGCSFVMRDDYNAGQRRPVNTLSGGETFLTSLSLALALSSKIQLKGQFPLGFFFLDEGFGTLDPEKLEVVVNTLEKLHDGQRVVGIITHVPELRSRMPRYLEISAAGIDGTGSRVVMKMS